MPERIEWTEHRVQLPKNRWARHQGDVKAFAATVADRNYVAHHSENGWEICEDTVAGWQARGYVKGHIVDGLATRRDLDLVLEADSRGLRRVLKEHLTEG